MEWRPREHRLLGLPPSFYQEVVESPNFEEISNEFRDELTGYMLSDEDDDRLKSRGYEVEVHPNLFYPGRTMPYPSNWNTIRQQVYKRDDYTCQNCGSQGGPRGPAELHAHHIVDAHSGGTHDPSNLITLCEDCHTATHNPGIMAPTAQPQPEAQAQPYGHAGSPSRNGRWWIHLVLLVFTLGIGNLVYWLWARWRFRRWQRRATSTTMTATVTPISARRRGGIRERYGGIWMHLLVALVTVWWTSGLGNVLYALWRRSRWDPYH